MLAARTTASARPVAVSRKASVSVHAAKKGTVSTGTRKGGVGYR